MFVLPLQAVGARFLFDTPGLDSTVLAPISCLIDGATGVTNFGINQFAKKESFSEINIATVNENISLQNTERNLSAIASVA